MGWFKRKKEAFYKSVAYIMQQIFLRTAGSWGSIIIDQDGNIIE